MLAADTRCADCHPDEAEAWAASPMAHSLRPRAEAPPAPFTHAAEVRDPRDGHTYVQRDGHFAVRAGEQQDGHDAAYVLGSGRHTHTLLWSAGDRLYQVPLSWYAADGRWDLSPGYAVAATARGFHREVGTGCVNCHADPVRSRPGSELHFEAPPTPMGCVRCHGDGRAHAEGRARGEATPITTPDRLAPARAADICAMCHFGGAVRVLRPGRQWADFLPGQPLSDTVALFARSRAEQGFGSSDQAGRLAQSACARGTPTMTCTTCHRPHDAEGGDRSQPCRGCHGPDGAAAAHRCAEAHGTAADADCAGCHMDEGPTHNIPHTSGIDHFIRIRPTPIPAATNDSPLRAVGGPPGDPPDADGQILLGRAYLDVWRSDRQPRDAERAEQWLKRGLAALPARADGWLALSTLARLRGDLTGAREAAERAFALEPGARRTATLVGWARLHGGDPAGALAALDRAEAVADSAELRVLRALALSRLGRFAEAVDSARAAVEREPSHTEGHLLLGEFAAQGGAWEAAATHFRAAAEWDPRDVRAWMHLGRAQAMHGAWAESRAAYAHAEQAAVDDPRTVERARAGQDEATRQLGGTPAADDRLRH